MILKIALTLESKNSLSTFLYTTIEIIIVLTAPNYLTMYCRPSSK